MSGKMQAARTMSQASAGLSPRCSLPSRLQRSGTVRVSCSTKEAKVIKGLRYDANMLRWVRDSRYGALDSPMVQPKTGIAYTAWPVVHTVLSEQSLKSVTVDEAVDLVSKGWTLVDVRVEDDYAKQHAEGSINLPLYRPVAGDEFWDKVKRIAMAGLAMRATERNPDFVNLAQQQLKKNQKVILICNIGGTLETLFKPSPHKAGINDPDRAFGRESRSLKAAYELIEEGGWSASNVRFLQGGLSQWRYDGQPVDSA